MLLYIIRHGETDYNVQKRLQGWIDEPLNENGRKIARLTGEGMQDIHFDLVISSPLNRALETARLVVNDPSVPVLTDRRIIELGNGIWEGKTPEEIEALGGAQEYAKIRKDPMHYVGPQGGESVRQVLERTADFLQEVIHRADYQDKTILISTHGGAMRALLNPFYEDREDFWHGQVPLNCAVNIVRVKQGEASLIEEDKIYYDSALISDHYKHYAKEDQ